MDWAKAKSVLIIAFIITNLFLGYNIIKDSNANGNVYTMDDERIDDVKGILEENDIIVEAKIPKEAVQLPKLTLEYESYDRKSIEKKFPGFTRGDEEYIRYYKEDEIIKIPIHKKSIIYKKEIQSSMSGEIDQKKAEEIAYAFIENHEFGNDEIELWNIQERDGKYEIEYKQKYESIILNDGYMKFTIKNGEITWFERRWLNPVDVKTFNKKAIPATKALLLSLHELEKKKASEESKVIVTDIELVYVLDIFKHRKIVNEQWYESGEKTASLYWRIRLEDKSYIDESAEVYE